MNQLINDLLKDYLHLPEIIKLFTNMWVADFETIVVDTNYYKKHKKTRIVYGVLKNIQFPSLKHTFTNINDMFKFITMNRKNNQYIYFHYLTFDGGYILNWLGHNGFKAVEKVKHEQEFSVFRTTGKKIYKIVVGVRNFQKKVIKITFLCSKELLNSSVKDLGKSVGLDKFQNDQENNPRFYVREPIDDVKEFERVNYDYCQYCERDVDIVINALIAFLLAIYDLTCERGYSCEFSTIRKSMTIAGMSFKLQLLELKKQGYDPDLLFMNDYEERMIMDDFTNGGLTILNEKFRKKSQKNLLGFMIDLQSAYPSIMRDYIPCGKMILQKPSDYSPDNYAHFIKAKYTNIRAKGHTVPLLKNWNMNYRAHLYMLEVKGEYETRGLEQELALIEKVYEYDSKEIVFECWYKLFRPFTDYIDLLFEYKSKYKKTNPARSLAFKILLNAGYGVHAKRFDFRSVMVERSDNEYIINNKEYKVVEHIDLNKKDRLTYVPNNRFVATEYVNPALIGIYNHKAVANYITAKTHCLLIMGMIHFGMEHFRYSDTDSLIIEGVPKEKVVAYCGKGIGKWELETWVGENGKVYDHFDEIYIGRSKVYQLKCEGVVIKTRVAGISNPDQMDIEELEKHQSHEFKDAFLKMTMVDGGPILIPCAKKIELADVELVGKGYKKYGVYFTGKK